MWTNHGYPQQLAAFVHEHWLEVSNGDAEESELPGLPMLEALISTAYQASLLREEERPLMFRMVLCEPESFPADDGPPLGLHRLIFDEYVPCVPQELKSLVHAANFYRSLLGIRLDGNSGPQIWGIVHSGTRWLHTQLGGKGSAPKLPSTLVINVTGPGCIEVCKGSVTVGQLSEGRVFGPSTNVFHSVWLQELFAETRAERTELHNQAKEHADADWATLDPELTHLIDQHMVKRVLAAIRAFRHGGTLIMVPPALAPELTASNRYINLRYKFVQDEPRARFRTLIVSMMNTLAENAQKEKHQISWQDYQDSGDPRVSALDEAIFEMSHLIAALSTVDGAVVMTRRFELLGFGAEIRCDLANVSTVARALDLEGKRFKLESTRGVGTRHRSAYDMCHELRETLAIVISQDGGVRFIRWQDKQVTYWDHQATFAFSQRF
ncbi:MAG: hypothetical protein K2X27_02105 [Candidatus Obscuribacterales bacterium]|nr:hypothetical protein [Candidatus Obscuribacterales bacterium]